MWTPVVWLGPAQFKLKLVEFAQLAEVEPPTPLREPRPFSTANLTSVLKRSAFK